MSPILTNLFQTRRENAIANEASVRPRLPFLPARRFDDFQATASRLPHWQLGARVNLGVFAHAGPERLDPSDNPFVAWVFATDANTAIPFSKITPEQVPAATKIILRVLAQQLRALRKKLENLDEPQWQDVYGGYHALNVRWQRFYDVLEFLATVQKDSWSPVRARVLPELTRFGLTLAQDSVLYAAFVKLADSGQLDEFQKTIVGNYRLNAYNAGVDLPGLQRRRYNAVEARIARLNAEFKDNITKDEAAVRIVIRDADALKGLEFMKNRLATAYAESVSRPGKEIQPDPEQGPWLITSATMRDVAKFSENPDLRRTVLLAVHGIAVGGKFDNEKIFTKVLRLGARNAVRLGYAHEADRRLSQGSFENSETWHAAFDPLWDDIAQAGQNKAQELEAWIAEQGTPDEWSVWNYNHYANKKRDADIQFKESQVKQYFRLDTALPVLFERMHQLYGAEIRVADTAEKWDPAVRYYEVYRDGQKIAAFYLDLYGRADKDSGPIAYSLVAREVDPVTGEVTLPLSAASMSFDEPDDQGVTYLSVRDLQTHFHEMGHLMQYSLYTGDYSETAGTNGMKPDTSEVASLFNEIWLYQPDILRRLGSGDPDKPIPEDQIQKIIYSRQYDFVRRWAWQMAVAYMDMAYRESGRFDQAVFTKNWERTGRPAYQDEPDQCFILSMHHFVHMPANYYAYSLSAAYAAAYSDGIDWNDPESVRAAGQRASQTLYAYGGGKPADLVYQEFAGKPFDFTPFKRELEIVDKDDGAE